MTKDFSLSLQLEPQGRFFRKDGKFLDVVLISGNKKYEAHRIVLAMNSSWFYEYFDQRKEIEKLEPNQKMVIDLPCNPCDCFSVVLDSIYTGKLELTPKNAPSIYKIVEFYGISKYVEPLKNYISKTISESTVLFYANQFIKYEMFEQASILTHFIAKCIHAIFDQPNTSHRVTLKAIYENVNDGRVFAEALNDKKLRELTKEEIDAKLERRYNKALKIYNEKKEEKNDQKPNEVAYNKRITFLTEDQKVSIVDEYVGDRRMNEEEREALAKVADWEKEDSYKYLVHYKCDWLPARISRELIKKILVIRKNSLDAFSKQSETALDPVSRWYPFSWITSIAETDETLSTPVVKIIDFISTLGGVVNEFNPQEYGFINPEEEGTILGVQHYKRFLVKNIFETNEKFYVGRGKGNVSPGFILKFGQSTRIKPERIIINSHIEKNVPHIDVALSQQEISKIPKSYRVAPSSVIIQTFSDGKESEEKILETRNGIGEKSFCELGINDEFDSIKVQLKGEGPIQVLRIKHIEIVGSFEPK